MASRPLTPPYVRFRIRRFNLLSIFARKVGTGLLVPTLRASYLEWLGGEPHFVIFASTLFLNALFSSLHHVGFRIGVISRILFEVASTVSRLIDVGDGLTIPVFL